MPEVGAKEQHLQETLLCSVKDISGSARKTVGLTRKAYEKLKKEFDIEIIRVTKPAGISAAAYAEQQSNAEYAEAPLKTRNVRKVSVGGKIPDPPTQMKVRLPGEEQGQFHARRMLEGKAYKKWEMKYGEAYAKKRSAKSDNPPEPAEIEAAAPIPHPDGASGDEAAAAAYKEKIEADALAELEAEHKNK